MSAARRPAAGKLAAVEGVVLDRDGTVPAGEPAPGPVPVPEQPTRPAPEPDLPPSTGPADRVPEHGLDDDERGEYPLTVHEAIAEVTRRVGVIAKDKQTTGGERFSFRGIDDVLAALHPILGEVGLVLMPGEVVERERETRQTARGGTLNVCHLRVRFTLVGPDGSYLAGEAWGEAGDSGDKATQKAASQAYKTFTLQTFSIPTTESTRDEPDSTHELSHPWSPEQLDRASRAWRAALNASTYANLATVRQQALAEGLLDVPVDGTALGVRFDERRAQLDTGGAS